MDVLFLTPHSCILPFFVVSWFVELIHFFVQFFWQSIGEEVEGLRGIEPIASFPGKLFEVGHIRVNISVLHLNSSFELRLRSFFFERVGKSPHEGAGYFCPQIFLCIWYAVLSWTIE